jgi:hypothetical protein
MATLYALDPLRSGKAQDHAAYRAGSGDGHRKGRKARPPLLVAGAGSDWISCARSRAKNSNRTRHVPYTLSSTENIPLECGGSRAGGRGVYRCLFGGGSSSRASDSPRRDEVSSTSQFYSQRQRRHGKTPEQVSNGRSRRRAATPHKLRLAPSVDTPLRAFVPLEAQDAAPVRAFEASLTRNVRCS